MRQLSGPQTEITFPLTVFWISSIARIVLCSTTSLKYLCSNFAGKILFKGFFDIEFISLKIMFLCTLDIRDLKDKNFNKQIFMGFCQYQVEYTNCHEQSIFKIHGSAVFSFSMRTVPSILTACSNPCIPSHAFDGKSLFNTT